MKTSIAAAALLLLVLTGCSSAVDAEGTEGTARQSSDSSEAATPTEAAPIPAESSAPVDSAPESPFGDYTQEEFFLKSIVPAWHGPVPTDEELVGAAALVCEQLTNGVAKDSVRAVEGTGADADWNNNRLVVDGITAYCPEFSDF
jgi:hypothetical protein